jgi:hypothetical protein
MPSVKQDRFSIDPTVPPLHFETDPLRFFVIKWTASGHVIDGVRESQTD